MLKKINVLVDLPDFGTIELPLVYTMSMEGNEKGTCLVNCKIMLSAENLPEWLLSTAFSIVYTQAEAESANIVSVCADSGTTNRYHEIMLSIVSSYIKLKEDRVGLN
ncbi:hypothetical protein [Pedobacter zeae]|uniref:Uncharacterized protein n=1 Tax=Pedobacter zeae TaxID=1737356 RepID=A0A7W6K8V5_9SPHI|nr:hypothetical protein [Pedobacter zeae]MBB4107355.1 hypothetical protein [Pedobacter zeae]GGH07410.1 hypothetical protein GCM10007422_24460 [Pedobacter zeae]